MFGNLHQFQASAGPAPTGPVLGDAASWPVSAGCLVGCIALQATQMQPDWLPAFSISVVVHANTWCLVDTNISMCDTKYRSPQHIQIW